MRSLTFSALKLTAAFGVAATLAFPVAASAQQPYGQQQPSYAQPPQASQTYCSQTAIKGTLSGFDGQWIVYMRDDKGYTDHITLHQGTVINPTGIKLLEGMRATICGYADGSTFQANQINVAYSPYSPYYGANGQPVTGYGYGGDSGYGDSGGYGDPGYGGFGYGGYGYPGYGYGSYPYFGIGINWGWGWGWGWPGWGWGYPGWGWGYPGYCCGYYGGGYYGG
ncbi:MAG: hypothetical protein JO113_09180, partial [Candidatus Eremiobacteraeota bacterium]|nr:hypothetical protein [Candidatus Eremiobacteraeota bacterium]